MALKNEKENYLRVGRIEGVDIYSGTAYIRIYQHDDEAGRKDHPMEPDKNYCIQEVKLSADQLEQMQKIAYDAVKAFDDKYADMINC